MAYEPLTREQYDKAISAGFSPASIIEMEKKRKAAETPKKSGIQKTMEFLAPSTLKTVGKLSEGKAPTLKEVGGTAFEIGSFFIPAGAAARAVGLGAKGLKALSLAQKARLGAGIGGTSGALAGAGQELGREESTAGSVFGSALGTGAAGAIGGAVLPPVGSALARIPGAVKAAPKVASAVIEKAGSTPSRIVGRAQEGIENVIERQKKIKEAADYAKGAIREGIDDVQMRFLQSGTKADKVQRAEMLDIAKKATSDLTSFDNAVRKPGETFLKGPVSHLVNVMKEGVKDTQAVIKKAGEVAKDRRNLYDDFVSDLKNMGAKVTKAGDIVIERGSRIPKGDLGFYKDVLRDLRPNAKGIVPLSDAQLHALRQKWFDVADTDKTFTSGISNYAKALRARLTKEIDQGAKGAYSKSQVKTREAIDALKEVARLLGYKGKIEDITAKDLKAGETFLRILGGASDRPNSVLNKAYTVAQKYGYKGTENIRNQLRFADMLQQIYGEPSRSLAGTIKRAGTNQDPAQVAAQGIREMVKWSPYSGAINLLRRSGFIGGRPEDLIQAFEDLVLGEAGKYVKKAAPAQKTVRELLERAKTVGREAADDIRKLPEQF